MILFEVHGAEETIDYLKTVKGRFAWMMQTMLDVADYVHSEVLHYTPLETGRLGESFKTTVLADNSKMKLVQVQMSALNPRTGYDYAKIQHFNTAYYHEHGQAFYMLAGIYSAKEGLAFEIIEKDYYSLVIGGK